MMRYKNEKEYAQKDRQILTDKGQEFPVLRLLLFMGTIRKLFNIKSSSNQMMADWNLKESHFRGEGLDAKNKHSSMDERMG